MSEFVVVTGMSGAGRSTAAAALEDMGWFVIDNLPAGLIMKMVEMVDRPGSGIERVALVIGRGGSSTGPEYFDDLPDVLDELRGTRQAGAGGLPRRARRRAGAPLRGHPPPPPPGRPGGGGVDRRRAPAARAGARAGRPAGRHGRAELEPAALAHPRRRSATTRRRTCRPRSISFGYKHGIPLDVDIVFDCRFLPNPFWVEELRPYSGLDEPVREYVLGQPESRRLPREGRRPADQHPPGLRPGGEVVPDHRHGLHRRAAPLGRAGRGAGGAARRRTGQSVSVFHRDIDR